MGAKVISVGILISVFGTLNGFILTGGRVPYTMACEGKIPFSKAFIKLNNNGVPLNGTWLLLDYQFYILYLVNLTYYLT